MIGNLQFCSLTLKYGYIKVCQSLFKGLYVDYAIKAPWYAIWKSGDRFLKKKSVLFERKIEISMKIDVKTLNFISKEFSIVKLIFSRLQTPKEQCRGILRTDPTALRIHLRNYIFKKTTKEPKWKCVFHFVI